MHSAVLKGAIDRSGAREAVPGHPVHTFLQENRELAPSSRLILPGTGDEGAALIAERIRASVEAGGLPEPRGPRTSCSVSLGLAVGGGASDSAASLLQRADQALMQAKRSGRNAALLWSCAAP